MMAEKPSPMERELRKIRKRRDRQIETLETLVRKRRRIIEYQYRQREAEIIVKFAAQGA